MSKHHARALTILCCALSTADGQRHPSTNPTKKLQPSLAERVMVSKAAIAPIRPKDIPGMDRAIQLLRQGACAEAVEGRGNKAIGITKIAYFVYPPESNSAEQKPDGNVEVIFAFGYVKVTPARILLLPPFFHPEKVQTKMLNGQTIPVNFLTRFEASHGFKPGSVTVEILQSLYLLHEYSHARLVAPPDMPCIVLSMIITRFIAQACLPEIVDERPPTVPTTLGVRIGDLLPKVRAAGTASCKMMCHPPKGPDVPSSKTGSRGSLSGRTVGSELVLSFRLVRFYLPLTTSWGFCRKIEVYVRPHEHPLYPAGL